MLLTNYRPGVLDRMGLGFDDLQQVNPQLIFAQASSWGPNGPWTTRPSRDTLAQAASGLMAKDRDAGGSAAAGRRFSSPTIRAR